MASKPPTLADIVNPPPAMREEEGNVGGEKDNLTWKKDISQKGEFVRKDAAFRNWLTGILIMS